MRRNEERIVSLPRIGIIISTTRATRFGDKPAQWIYDIASERDDLEVEIVDLRDYPMPFFEEIASNAHVPSANPVAKRWQEKIASLDGYIFVTAEYNHSIPASLKNALDYASTEWNRKPSAVVGYGMVGAARAVEHLRLIAVELQMVPVRSAVHVQGADFLAAAMHGKDLSELDYLRPVADNMLNDLAWWAAALQNARELAAVA